jgi:hypothetical protein
MGLELRILGLGFIIWVWSPGFRVYNTSLELRVLGIGFRVQDLAFRL